MLYFQDNFCLPFFSDLEPSQVKTKKMVISKIFFGTLRSGAQENVCQRVLLSVGASFCQWARAFVSGPVHEREILLISKFVTCSFFLVSFFLFSTKYVSV
jgi:hypothetical protein